jgi:hypothetical protein
MRNIGIVVAALSLFALGSISTVLVLRGSLHRSAYQGVECQTGNMAKAATSEDNKILQLVGAAWMSRAQVCSIGGFTVVVPAAQAEGHIIDIYKGLKPVFQRTRDGSFDYSPTVPDGKADQMVVNLWHPCEGDVTKLIYTTRGKEPHSMVEDRTFSGLPNERVVWNGSDIQETYVMYQDGWHSMQKGKILIDGQWLAIRFTGGEWRVKGPNDTEPSPPASEAFGCPDAK